MYSSFFINKRGDSMLFLVIINVILIILLIFSLILNFKNRKDLKDLISIKENEILKEILNLGFSNNEKNSYITIVQALKKYYKIDDCSVLLKKDSFECVASNVDTMYIEDIELQCDSLLSELKGSAKISYSENYFSYKSSRLRAIKYFYFIPLVNDNEVIGAIFIENKLDYKEKMFEVEFFNIVIRNITIVLQNCLYQEKIMNLAMRDNLTQMYNRNYMESHIKELTNSKKRFSLAMLDIDFFKKFNDTYGHEFGDLVLKEVSNLIKSKLRKEDEIYRWGGEEFIISISSDIKQAAVILDRIREIIANYSISNGIDTVNITVSFGVAEFPKHGYGLEELLSCADKALYESKENGRNRVTIYEE
ncbi:GGDEF domain-containing protein [Clostridium botulinum]|nr:GGDEF domain-containing protein [Clostridium botulinum]